MKSGQQLRKPPAAMVGSNNADVRKLRADIRGRTVPPPPPPGPPPRGSRRREMHAGAPKRSATDPKQIPFRVLALCFVVTTCSIIVFLLHFLCHHPLCGAGGVSLKPAAHLSRTLREPSRLLYSDMAAANIESQHAVPPLTTATAIGQPQAGQLKGASLEPEDPSSTARVDGDVKALDAPVQEAGGPAVHCRMTVPRDGAIWMDEHLIKLTDSPIVVRYQAMTTAAAGSPAEIIGAFSLNRATAGWGTRRDSDALTWYAGTSPPQPSSGGSDVVDFTFRGELFKTFPPVERKSADQAARLILPNRWVNVEVMLTRSEISYSVDGKEFAALTDTGTLRQHDEGYIGMVAYSTEWDVRGVEVHNTKDGSTVRLPKKCDVAIASVADRHSKQQAEGGVQPGELPALPTPPAGVVGGANCHDSFFHKDVSIVGHDDVPQTGAPVYASAVQCCNSCMARPGCTAFTWVSAGMHCWFKVLPGSGDSIVVGYGEAKAGAISGSVVGTKGSSPLQPGDGEIQRVQLDSLQVSEASAAKEQAKQAAAAAEQQQQLDSLQASAASFSSDQAAKLAAKAVTKQAEEEQAKITALADAQHEEVLEQTRRGAEEAGAKLHAESSALVSEPQSRSSLDTGGVIDMPSAAPPATATAAPVAEVAAALPPAVPAALGAVLDTAEGAQERAEEYASLTQMPAKIVPAVQALPAVQAALATPAEPAAPAVSAASARQWIEVPQPTGPPYFWNQADGLTTWTRPVGETILPYVAAKTG